MKQFCAGFALIILVTRAASETPQVTTTAHKDITLEGNTTDNVLSLTAGYRGDITCRLDNMDSPGLHTTHLSCGYLAQVASGSEVTLSFQADPLTGDLDGAMCFCSGHQEKGCYSPETVFTLDVAYTTVTNFITDKDIYTEGETAEMNCEARGTEPFTLSLTREKTLAKLAVESGHHRDETVRVSHTMRSLECQDNGAYICEAGTDSKKVDLFVRCSQRLSPGHPSALTVVASVGETKQLTVPIFGFPAPTSVILTRGDGVGTKLTKSSRHVVKYSAAQHPFGSVDVKMSGLTEEDFAAYTITVDNGVGSGFEYRFTIRKECSDAALSSEVVAVGWALIILIIALLVIIIIVLVRANRRAKKPAATDSPLELKTHTSLNTVTTHRAGENPKRASEFYTDGVSEHGVLSNRYKTTGNHYDTATEGARENHYDTTTATRDEDPYEFEDDEKDARSTK